jgi:hypothetical protein
VGVIAAALVSRTHPGNVANNVPAASGSAAGTTPDSGAVGTTTGGVGSTTTVTGVPVVASSTQPGVAVSPGEARDVAGRLWQARMVARNQRDAATLRMVEAGPALEADLGLVCGCAGPLETALSTTVNVPRQTTWPVDLFATVTFELPDCPVTPCDDSFVAVQASQGAAWKIVLVVNYSGTVYSAQPVNSSDGFATPPDPVPERQFRNLPAEYAQYLHSLKETGQPPGLTRLGTGPFTSDLASHLYNPPSQQQARGELDSVSYFVAPSDPVWRFAAEYGVQVTCGTVRYQDDRHPLPGQVLTQPGDHSAYGSLTPGDYSSIVIDGIRTVCFEAYPDPSKPIGVFGAWGDVTHVSGSPVTAPA